MAELGLYMFQLELLVQELLPELHAHFQSQSFHTSMYASSWFLTLFTSVLPFPVATRCMDLFLSEGIEMVFRLGIAILQICKEDILLLDMEEMIKVITAVVYGALRTNKITRTKAVKTWVCALGYTKSKV